MKRRFIEFIKGRENIRRMQYFHIISSSIYGIVSIPFLINVYIQLKQRNIEFSLTLQFLIAVSCLLIGIHHMNLEIKMIESNVLHSSKAKITI